MPRSAKARWEVRSLTKKSLFRKPSPTALTLDEQKKSGKRMKKSAVILRLFRYLGAHKGMLALALLLTVLANGIALIGPQLSEYAIDAIELESGVDLPRVAWFCLAMLICYAVSSVLSYLLSLLMITISRRVVYRMRKEVFDHLLTLPVSYFDKNQTGDIISRLSYDIDTVNTSLSNDLVQILAGSITLVGSFAMMAKLCPILLPLYLLTVPILVAFTCYRVKKVKPLFRQRSARLGMLNGYAEEMLSGQKTIRAYGKEEVMINRFDRHNHEAVEAYYAADYQGSIVGPGVNFINNLTISLISMLGALLYMLSGAKSLVIGSLVLAAMTPGKLSAFILYSRKFLGPINETANIVSEIQSATSAAERIFRLLDEPSEAANAPSDAMLDTVKGRFEIRALDFAYTPSKPILKGINLTVEAGKTVAIVGPTGSGKTTFVNLLMRFYECGEGKIFLDGVDISHLPLDVLRRQFAMVLQDTWLFGATVAENIAYGSVGATREDVIAAAKTARIHHLIESLPEGYDTVMDETNISKGQKQLITIARMLLVHHPILILDEATSNVDSRTEKLLTEAMDTITKGRTSFIIAHRLSTVKNADLILVLKDGEIIEQGSHDALLKKGGFYASLYLSQFDGSDDNSPQTVENSS